LDQTMTARGADLPKGYF